MARREKIQANFGATRKGWSPQESAGTLVDAREGEKNAQLHTQLGIGIGGRNGKRAPVRNDAENCGFLRILSNYCVPA